MQIVTADHVEDCLKFANTVDWHASAHPNERLHSYADLLAWAEQKGIAAPLPLGELAQLAEQQPKRAAEVFARAIALREAIYAVCVAQLHGHSAAEADLALINAELGRALTHGQLAEAAQGFAFTWARGASLDAILWPLAGAAADLLASPELLARLGQCADERGCGWLFIDTSKNHSRRWCDINDCGNRAKQRRHQARVRTST